LEGPWHDTTLEANVKRNRRFFTGVAKKLGGQQGGKPQIRPSKRITRGDLKRSEGDLISFARRTGEKGVLPGHEERRIKESPKRRMRLIW